MTISIDYRLSHLRDSLIECEVARDPDIEGVTDSELSVFEKRWGKLPVVYKSIMKLIGKRAGMLVDEKEFSFYLHQLDALNKKIRDSNQEALAEGDNVAEIPDGAIFISARYMQNPSFIICDEKEDSLVYFYNEEDEVVELQCESIWDWLNDFVEDAKKFI